MKKLGIIMTAMAALALAVFAVAEAQDDWGTDVNQRLFGHTIEVVAAGPGEVSTAAINGIAKGEPGRALVTAMLVYRESTLPPTPNPNCPADFPFGQEIIRFEWGETYNDGSMLAGYLPPPGVICSDGILSVVDLVGVITGGTGRFEGGSGTWAIEASSPLANTTTTGTLTVDLD